MEASISRRETDCPLCGQPMTLRFSASDYRRPSVPDIFRVYWCEACAYGKVAPSPTPAEVARFYEVDYYTHSAPAASRPPTLLERVRLHIAWRLDQGVALVPAELGPPGSLLDIGCGDGTNMARFRAAGFSVAGVEPDSQARTLAARYGAVVEGTAENFRIPDAGSFRYCLMANSLEHVVSPGEALRAARGALRPGGTLVIEVPNCASLGFRQFGPLWPWTDLPRHLHFFTQQSLTRFVEAAGFTVTRVLHVGFARQFDRAWVDEIRLIDRTARHDDFRPGRRTAESWGLLLRCLGSADELKYDSFRLHATVSHLG